MMVSANHHGSLGNRRNTTRCRESTEISVPHRRCCFCYRNASICYGSVDSQSDGDSSFLVRIEDPGLWSDNLNTGQTKDWFQLCPFIGFAVNVQKCHFCDYICPCCSYERAEVFQTNHLVFSSLPDPADVVIILLSDAISHMGADFLQDSGGNVVRFSQILWVAGCAHPAERAKAQGEDVTRMETGLKSFFKMVSTGILKNQC